MFFDTDIFALGIVIFECLTGIHPFLAENEQETTNNIRNGKQAQLPNWVPAEMKKIVMKMININKSTKKFKQTQIDQNYKTEDPKVYPTETFFVWLTRLREHFQQSPTNIIHLFRTENWKQADQRYIRTRLERLIQTLGVQNAIINSFRHASSTELVAQDFDWRTINVFTHHTPDSKMNQYFYVFAVNKEQDSIASALVKNHGKKQATQIISKQRGGARVSDGDRLQQSPQGDDLQLPPQETLASPLSLPIISSQPIVEAESPNDHESAKVQNSQMQKDDQDVEPQDEAQNSSMTKDSDRATSAGAQK
ncbi:MAG: hypothetical protein EZS28_021410 [Streblomastix strix]|uniref:Protein kinase domain-containing protein n=1 Tax=Streblomastix strix TaxID=222440 RepID=A0A5J4VKF8_9EUKA|nr:MAG: hypothetical protein EZS28_021410 [Streblomastix strix]